MRLKIWQKTKFLFNYLFFKKIYDFAFMSPRGVLMNPRGVLNGPWGDVNVPKRG